MAARVIHESLDGGEIAVADDCPIVGCSAGVDRVVITATERGLGHATLHLTRDEADGLIDALIARNQEIDAAALSDQATQDTRSPAPPVAEDRATAAGPSTPPAGPGRPIDRHLCGGPDCSGHRRPDRRCLATGTEEWSAEEMAREVEILDPRPEPQVTATEAPPTWFLSSGLSIAEITAARLAADPASAEVPFEAGGALHVVDRCGCSDCEDAYVQICRERSRPTLASMLGNARGVLANSTHIGPAGGAR